MHQPLGRVSSVFDNPIAVDIAVPVDPLQGQLDVGPDRFDKRHIPGALVVGRRQDDEERGRVHRAVILPERDLAERREFPEPGFVEDFARLSIPRRDDLPGLYLGQIS